MRNATICFLLMLCSVVAFGQQPQWTVIQNVVLFNQAEAIPPTMLFTPSEVGMYRITFYFSGVGGTAPMGLFSAYYFGTDISGNSVTDGAGMLCARGAYHFSPPVTASLKPNTPFMYQVRIDIPASSLCAYNLAITVEQLVQ